MREDFFFLAGILLLIILKMGLYNLRKKRSELQKSWERHKELKELSDG